MPTWLLAGLLAAAPPTTVMHGMSFTAWTPGGYDAPTTGPQLDALVDLGVDTISLVARGFQDGIHATKVANEPTLGPPPDEVRLAIRKAKERGLAVLLKPQIDPLPGRPGWRGEIAFDSEADWQAWFASYTAWIVGWADLAREEGVRIFCIGVELDGTRFRADDWRKVAAVVREHFPGPLTFAANWNRETDIEWCDALDYLGVDAYYPLADRDDATVDELCAAWQPHLKRLTDWSERWHKPILLTEIGYRSAHGAAQWPWEWELRQPVNLDLQARLYEAAMRSFSGQSWYRGAFWWLWFSTPIQNPAQDDGFSPQDKPAAKVLRRFYATAPNP